MRLTDQQIFDTLARFFAQAGTGREGAIAVTIEPDEVVIEKWRLRLREELSRA